MAVKAQHEQSIKREAHPSCPLPETVSSSSKAVNIVIPAHVKSGGRYPEQHEQIAHGSQLVED